MDDVRPGIDEAHLVVPVEHVPAGVVPLAAERGTSEREDFDFCTLCGAGGGGPGCAESTSWGAHA